MPVKQRFFACAVASQHQALCPFIPECDRKHAIELADEVRAQLFVKVDDDLAIRTGFKAMPALNERITKLAIVIDFPVENHGDLATLVEQRLITGFEVNDAQTPDTKRNVWQFELTVAVRPAVVQALRHAFDTARIGDGLK